MSLKDRLATLETVKALRLAQQKNEYPIEINGLSQTAKSVVLLGAATRCVVVTSDGGEAAKIAAELNMTGQTAVFFPARDITVEEYSSSSKDFEQKRIASLISFLKKDAKYLVMDIEAASILLPDPGFLVQNTLDFSIGENLSMPATVEKLINLDYSRCESVEGPGQFAVRGDILDLFSPEYKDPVRIEFFGDTVEKINFFNADTQRKTESADRFSVYPASERGIIDFEKLDAYARSIKGKNEPLCNRIENDLSGGIFPTDRYMAFYKPRAVSIFDYFDCPLVLSDFQKIKNRLTDLDKTRSQEIENYINRGLSSKKIAKFYLTKSDFLSSAAQRKVIYLDSFITAKKGLPPKTVIDSQIKTMSVWGGNLNHLINDIKEHNAATTIIVCVNEKSAQIIAKELQNNGVKATVESGDKPLKNGVFCIQGTLSSSLYFKGDDLLVISHGTAFQKKKNRHGGGKKIAALSDLNVGDYVVHYAHGIGVFEGVTQIKQNGIVKDYLKINYRGSDCLYVPVTQLDLISKYIGGKDGKIVLNKLGGTEWQKARHRAKKAVHDMAKQLSSLYAARSREIGYAFGPDSTAQDDFEDRFIYEETDDQIAASAEIKRDMERSVPMDRLLCGDVGFGKTEVALRAAFKCIDGGKQCAILVPTTLLAKQHYDTALSRFYGFPIDIELLSRFKSAKELKQSLTNIRRGSANLIIGTHRMFSKDVEFFDLGLLIIDEEQRFGVAQKEKIKEKYKGVDTLTLSATPIPRTLNMAMSGLRDMSSIEEAPRDRYPVQTYVIEQQTGVILDAINKELRRGGQVFYLHNNVETIYHTAAKLKSLLPSVNIDVAHGKMSEEEITNAWQRLIDRQTDLLVCTTIIETGVDIPSVNTLIVEDADRYGLAQLHQIRGRVGRSSIKAYAYFCFRPNKQLSEIAEKRLCAIRDFTKFGSGFAIAMRDLEIRGAGNILGGEQHGHIEAVGYDLYVKMLREEVEEAKGETKEEKVECTADLDINASIPQDYISYLPARLQIYRRIAAIQSAADADDVIEELRDRFGEPPKQVRGLVDVALIRGVFSRHGICEITQRKNVVKLSLKTLDLKAAAEFLKRVDNTVTLDPGAKPGYLLKIPEGASPLEMLKTLSQKL